MKTINFVITFLATFILNVASAQIANGVYFIHLSNGFVMEAEGNTFNNDGCKIQNWTNYNGINQKWEVTRMNNGAYRIKNLGSNKMLDAAAQSLNTNGGKVQLWENFPTNRNQEWILTQVSTGRFAIRSAASVGNKVLDVTGYAIGTHGTAIQLWDYSTSNTSNQIWTFLPTARPVVVSTRVMTRFDPAVHGFKFRNDFISNFAGIDFAGLCGGMAYASLDYFNNNIRVPSQTTPPPLGTSLRQYIYDRQQTSTTQNSDKWAELGFNPFGSRTGEFFNWGLQGFNGGRLQELKAEIDAGRPVPLGLFKGGNGGFANHHQVLAIGYDLGRYKGDLGQYKEDMKIFVYDSNFPNVVRTLVPNLSNATYYYLEERNCSWMTYFVDRKYRTASPPRL